MNKKGLSPIIATTLLIALTVAAITLLAAFIIPFVRTNTAQSTECIPYQDYFGFQPTFIEGDNEISYNCYDLATRNIGFSVKSSSNNESGEADNVIGFSIVLSVEGTSKSIQVKDGDVASSDPGKVRMLNSVLTQIKIPKGGEVQTFVYNSDQLYQKAEVYPIIKTKDGKERICSVSDNIKITKCDIASRLKPTP